MHNVTADKTLPSGHWFCFLFLVSFFFFCFLFLENVTFQCQEHFHDDNCCDSIADLRERGGWVRLCVSKLSTDCTFNKDVQLRELQVPHSLLDKLRSQQILAGKCREEGSMRKEFVNGAAGQWHTQAWRGKFPSACEFLKQADPHRVTVERTGRWSQMVEILADQQGALEVRIKLKRNCYWILNELCPGSWQNPHLSSSLLHPQSPDLPGAKCSLHVLQ